MVVAGQQTGVVRLRLMKANESTSHGLLVWLGALKSDWELDSMLNKKSCLIERSKCGTMEPWKRRRQVRDNEARWLP